MITAHSSFTTANSRVAKKPIVALEIDGYDRVFTTQPTGVDGHVPWISEISDLSFDVSSLEGSCSLGDLTVTVLDKGRALTADMPSITLEGRVCRLKTGFVGMSYSNFVTLFTGKIDIIPSSNNNNSYDFVCKDTRINLKQLVYETGDDGQPTDNDHPKTIVGHPLDIAKSVMFDYIGLTLSDVDEALFDAYRDELFAGAIMEFKITSPPEAKAFLEGQIFKPLGGYLRASNLGVLKPHFFMPLAGTVTPVMTLDKTNLVEIPQAQQADLINQISFRMDKAEDKFTSESIKKYQASIDKYGLQGQQVIEADGVRSAYQGYYIAALTSNAIFSRFGNKNPRFEVKAFWPACLVEPGDLVYITHAQVPNRRAGVMGFTNELFEVESMSMSFSDYTVTMTLVDASSLSTFGHWRIAPDSKVAWTSATTEDKDRYMYISNASGEYSDSTAGHTLA